VNTTADGGGNAFGAETTKDVEVGVKYSGREAGLPITFNADFFNQWVNNIQRAAYVLGPGGSPNLLTVNVPKAEITGVEFDASVRPAPWLLLGASGAYINARYTSGAVDLVIDAGNGGTNLETFNYGPYADTPKWTGSVYAQVNHELADHLGELTLRADVYAQTRMFFSNVANTRAPGTVIPGYSLTNARLSWSKIAGSGLSAAVYVRNVFNKEYFPGGNAIGQALGVNTINTGQPRFFGGEVRFDF
jgi:iron complex outermembrane receptor protein